MAKDWKGVKNTVIVPNQILAKNRKYPICFTIKDELQNELNGTLVVVVKDRKVWVEEEVRPMN